MADLTLDHLAGELNRLTHELGECAGLVRDLQLNSRPNIHRIGEAIVKLVEVQQDITAVRPDLESRVFRKDWVEPRERITASVRAATLADEEATLDLIEQLFEPPGGPPPEYSRERGSIGFRWAVEQPNAEVLLAFDRDVLVGLSSVYADIQSIRFGPRCWLQDLVVREDRRAQRIGGQLMRASAEWARAHGCTHVELGSGAGRADAHRFYRAQGMVQSMDFMLWLD